MEAQVQHEPDRARFVIRVSDFEAILNYRLAGDRLELYRTYVPPELGGRGLAAELAVAALDHARNEGRSVLPTCSYIDRFIANHPEYCFLIERSP